MRLGCYFPPFHGLAKIGWSNDSAEALLSLAFSSSAARRWVDPRHERAIAMADDGAADKTPKRGDTIIFKRSDGLYDVRKVDASGQTEVVR